MGLELFLALPGHPFQIIMLEDVDEDFRLVQPRGIGGRIAWLPPSLTLGEISLRTGRYVAGSTVLDQEDTS